MDKNLISISKPIEKSAYLNTEKVKSKPKNNIRWRTIVTLAIYLIVIPAVIIIGVKLFADRKYNIISIVIAFLACVPFFIGFEKGKAGARELVVIATLTAISVLGRLIFAPIPGFKPVTAIV